MNFLYYLKLVIEIIAIIIILWGLIIALYRFVKNELQKKNSTQQILDIENIRGFLATYILLGLEIFIVADIIQIIMYPTTEDLIILIVIVIVRTIISYFLEKDYRSSLHEILKNKDKE